MDGWEHTHTPMLKSKESVEPTKQIIVELTCADG